MDIVNVKLSNPRVHIEDHGFLTFDVTVEGNHWRCDFGGYALGVADNFTSTNGGIGLVAMMHIMDVVGVKCWEDLDGKYCRVVEPIGSGSVTTIGNLIEDKWFNIKEFYEDYVRENM